jgi:uncharacterized protein YdhG (YjbR/CyaY superfamily)
VKAASSIDEYLEGVPPEKAAELARLRAIVRDEVPEAIEAIAYAMPAFRLGHRYFLGFAATKSGCSLYTGRGALHEFASELEPNQRHWKGTINYASDSPLPEDLVRRIVRLRFAELRGT